MNFMIKLFQCFFCWVVKPSSEKELKNAHVVLGQAFGMRLKSSGKSNEALAGLARNLYQNHYPLPMILQGEIADCLPDLSVVNAIKEHRIKGKYLDTYEALFQMSIVCKQYNWTKAIMLAHPHHYWRCMMVAKKLGFETLAIDTSSVPYDELSTQLWTRNAWLFIPREIGARLVYLLTGKI